MDTKMACKVVVWPRKIHDLRSGAEEVEVTVRGFEEPPPCPACGKAEEGHDALKAAAYIDGILFGEMLAAVGSSEYRRGMLDALRQAGYLQSKGTD